MQPEDGKESLNHDHVSVFDHAVKVEEHLLLLELGRQEVLAATIRPPSVARPAAGVCHQLAAFVMAGRVRYG